MTIADKLRIVLESKEAIKATLESKGKEPTSAITTYAGLIDGLDNEDQTSYVLSNAEGTQKVYAQLSSKDPISLTATENDIRQNTTAITDVGYTEGTKDIPAYHSATGQKIILAGQKVSISLPKYAYSELQATISKYNTSINNSVEVVASTIEDSVYEAKSTTKLADITNDSSSQSIQLNVTADIKSVLRYFTMKEE